ncbi:hypothetical protein TSAR_010435 [Trichomalopsis sarcophagae]|uniref:Uncharacterized protein n=1 Tax=Trichomalopsis sarcophagae TaxID=543379 RepID=A0A232ET20_9HYME|nr:hypothetical protein TSAR_010435 [Trichomalopsis sarcophagae]
MVDKSAAQYLFKHNSKIMKTLSQYLNTHQKPDCLGYNVTYFNSSGNSKKLITQLAQTILDNPLCYSLANNAGLFSFCNHDKSNSKVYKESNTVTVSVHNLVGGDMLVFVIHCDVASQDFLRIATGYNAFRIQRIRTDGRKYKALIIDGFETDYTTVHRIFLLITENDQIEFCFILSGEMPQLNRIKNYRNMLYNKLCIPKQSTLKL